MKNLYLVSTKAYAGKTMLALALAKDAQRRGLSVRYFKPVGPHPVVVDDVLTDKDAQYVMQMLGEQAPPAALCPVPVTATFQQQLMADTLPPLIDKVKSAHAQVAQGADLVLMGGMGSLFHAGLSFGLPAWEVADALDAQILVVARWKPDRIIDELLSAKRVLGDRMIGAVINAVRPDALERACKEVKPYLEKHGVTVFGVIPEVTALHAIPVGDLVVGLGAKVLAGEDHLEDLVENFAIGAMTPEAALSHFRKIQNKAVITGGDRSDIQCAAMETSLKALILTGGYEPAPKILATASQRKIPVLLVHEDTITTIERIDALQEHQRFRQTGMISRAEQVVGDHVDLDRLWEKTGIGVLGAVA
ncbi:MAG: phosphotransacetylase family protein [Armatimonadota bacterium]